MDPTYVLTHAAEARARLSFACATDRPSALVAERVSRGRGVLPSELVNWVTISTDAVHIGAAREAGRR